jgi:hypothetical protein
LNDDDIQQAIVQLCFGCDGEVVAKLVAVGDRKPNTNLAAVDVAAAASVINALMNYDGCVVKR